MIERTLREAILNGQDVHLLDGSVCKVRPWGIDDLQTMLPILASIVVDIQNADPESLNLEAATFLIKYSKQISGLVQLTLGYDDSQMKTLTAEDYLQLANAVIETCIVRPDGGGPLGELLRLYGNAIDTIRNVVGPALIKIAETDSKRPSQPSGPGVTRSTKSEATPPN